ncbi:flavin monoamine oxidase family protein [Nocardioides hankookensis]|uniref:Flavin monoamine oxidase family protein n=1 Tax=Nocardioides hankookensis TaxID=443157 RepID=A0ABW1LFD6_9ACTN
MTDVIVVGAGLAGLSAARSVQASGRSVVVVEARDRVGGRTEAGRLEDGQWIELGGQWIGPTQDRMYELVGELGLTPIPTYNDGDIVFGLCGRTGRLAGKKGAIPRLNPFAIADLAQGTLRFARLARRIDLERPWESPDAELLDGQTFRTWVRRNLRTPQGRAYFELYCEAVFSAGLSDVSLLHALFYTHSGTDMDTLMAVDRGAQQDRIDGGSLLISERMAADLDVRLSSPVRTVSQMSSGVRVTTRDGTSYDAARAIITLPPTLAGRLEYDPVLPSWRDQLTQKLPAGSVFKVYAVYPTPFWREDGLNGQAGSDVGPVKVTFDNTPPGYERGILMGFIEAGDGRHWARRTPEERRAAVVESFVRYFGPRAAEPLEYVERDWMAEEFSRGCYGAHLAPGVWTSYGAALREPVGRLHWAGAECSPVWNGYMEGAVRSGEATAAEVLRLL